jgi:glycosyltransferase involved in cell wall biosynthesis
MKIGHINLTKEYGGSSHQLLMLAKALSRHGIGQHVIVRNPMLAQRLAELPDISVGPVVNSPVTAYAMLPNVDLVHVHDRKSLPTGLLMHLTRSVPYIITQRSLTPPTANGIVRSVYRRAEGIACVSEAVAETMSHYCPETPIDSIHDACSTYRTCMPSPRTRVERQDSEFVVGHVGDLDDSTKGQGIILDIAEELVDVHPRVRFVLIGNGKDEARLKDRASHLPNVFFTGWLPNLEVCYETMDVFLFPSRKEALGSAMLEAMTYHLPVIASNVGGIPEIIRHGREGILCGPNDRRGFRDALMALYDDVNLRKRLGGAACARARHFTAERMAAGYARLYRRALDTNRVAALLI